MAHDCVPTAFQAPLQADQVRERMSANAAKGYSGISYAINCGAHEAATDTVPKMQ